MYYSNHNNKTTKRISANLNKLITTKLNYNCKEIFMDKITELSKEQKNEDKMLIANVLDKIKIVQKSFN